ncbi:hypothetical protein Nmel_015795 [Mimus melanotis]
MIFGLFPYSRGDHDLLYKSPPLLSPVGKNVSPLQVIALLGCELPFCQKDCKDPTEWRQSCSEGM